MADLNELDRVWHIYEKKWGAGVLPTLVGEELQAKWNMQTERLNQLIRNNVQGDELSEAIEATIRALGVLNREARDRGHVSNDLNEDYWLVVSKETGKKFRICRDKNMAAKSALEGYATYSVDEIVNTLEHVAIVNKAKEMFPGATVEIKKNNEPPF